MRYDHAFYVRLKLKLSFVQIYDSTIMAALMAAATIWVSTVLTMSIFATICLHARYMSMLMVEPMFQKAAAIIAAIKQNLNPCFWTTLSSPAAIICVFSHFWKRILVSGSQISFLPPLMPPLFIYSKSWKSGEHFHYLSFFLKISSLCCTDPLAINKSRQPQCKGDPDPRWGVLLNDVGNTNQEW